jgi:stress-induced morphogen
MEDEIKARITEALKPTSVQVACKDASSGKYAVLVVSDAFEGKNALQRHRAVNAAVRMSEEETAAKIHALEITAKTPTEAATA